MKLFVYNMRPFDEKAYFQAFSSQFNISCESTAETPSLETVHLAKGYDAISIVPSKMNAPLIDAFYAIGVRLITTRSIGYEHIDIAHAEKIGMHVSNVAYAPESVADYAIMLMMMSLRRMPHILSAMRHQNFALRGKIGRDLSQCTIGIIGGGQIGRTVLRHLSGFGARLLVYGRHPDETVAQYASYVALDTLLSESDVISLHVQMTPENHHLIDAGAIEKMKPGVVLINTARGALIDTTALISGLESGKIGAAALDVLENENRIYFKDRSGECLNDRDYLVLSGYPNVILSSHVAFYTDKAISDMAESTFKSLLAYAVGEDNPLEITRI
ncbi:MAG: hypothetical protein PWQ12_2029 [Clostridiales bacterium]|jgi:D-lactate dehydrogenase|nr:hypothetical protein [Clostridiales bacterium]